MPLAVAIPIVVEPGELAGPSRPGATPNPQPGAAALPLEASFRAQLQTMFAADSDNSESPDVESPPALRSADSQVPSADSQQSGGRTGAAQAQSAPRNPAPNVSPGARSLPQPPATRASFAAPLPAEKPAAPQSAPAAHSASPRRAVPERSSHSGAAINPLPPSPVLLAGATMPQPFAAPSKSPVPPPTAPTPHIEDDLEPSLARTSGATGEPAAPTAYAGTAAIPRSAASRQHSEPSPQPGAITAHSAVSEAAASASTSEGTPALKHAAVPALEHASTPAPAREPQTDLHPAAALTSSAAAVPAPPVEHAENSQPAPAPESQADLHPAAALTSSAAAVPAPPVEHAENSQPAPAPESQADLHPAAALTSSAAAVPAPPAGHAENSQPAPVSRPPAERAAKSQTAPVIAPMHAPGATESPAKPSAPAPAATEAPSAEKKAEPTARFSNASTPAPPAPGQHAATPTPASAQLAASPAHAATLIAPRESASSSGLASTAHADTFAALDAEPTAPPATWIHAGPTRAEAGFLDPSLGWVGVRADVAGNTLHASIVPSSAQAAQALGSHLAGLNTYLADHQVAAAPLTMAPPPSSQSLAGDSGFNPSGQQAGQQQRDGQPSAASNFDSTSPHAADASSAPPVTGFETAAAPAWSGGHISVIA